MKPLITASQATSLLAILQLAAGPLRAAEALVADKPIPVAGAKGGFDFLEVDPAQRRLLASHTGNSTLDVFDLDTGKLIKLVPTGKAQDAAVDSEAGVTIQVFKKG